MSERVQSAGDIFLDRLKKSRDVNAVQKVEFASFASAIPDDTLIFSFEGPDDRVIYYSWIGKISPSLKYESYQCNGKRQVLQLFDILSKDQTGLGKRVYYFVDHDFDGLQGRTTSDRIFITDCYSVESYLLCELLLESLLNVTFHCNGLIDLRKDIAEKFLQLYDQFLNVTREVNFRMFLARIYKIDIEDMPVSLHVMVKINLESVEPLQTPAQEIIVLRREPSQEERNSAIPLFNSLDPRKHYRGKYSLLFFSRWLGLLRNDRMSTNSKMFANAPMPANTIHGDFSFQYLAEKARAPNDLEPFLEKILSSSKKTIDQ